MAQPPALEGKPSEIDLDDVSKNAGDKWRSLLTHLGVPLAKCKALFVESRGDPVSACFEGLVFWKEGNKPCRPPTWSVLQEALEKGAEKREYAEELKKENLIKPKEAQPPGTSQVLPTRDTSMQCSAIGQGIFPGGVPESDSSSVIMQSTEVHVPQGVSSQFTNNTSPSEFVTTSSHGSTMMYPSDTEGPPPNKKPKTIIGTLSMIPSKDIDEDTQSSLNRQSTFQGAWFEPDSSPMRVLSTDGLPSSSSPVTRGESTQAMSTMDERPKITEIADRYKNGELLLPSNPDLENELDDILGNLSVNLSSADARVIRKLQAIVQRKYRRYIHGVRPVQLPPVPNTANGLYEFIAEKSTPYEIFLVHHAVEVLEDKNLKRDLQEYEKKLAKYLKEMLTSCKRKRVTLPLREDHTHMAVVISKEQVLLALVLKMKEYFSKYLQLEDTLFEGFEEGCTVLFFSILTVDAALLSPKVLSHLSELKRMFGMTHLIVFGYFACDLEKATIELVNKVPASFQTELERVTQKNAELEEEKDKLEREKAEQIVKLKMKEEESKKEAEMYRNSNVQLAKDNLELEDKLKKTEKQNRDLKGKYLILKYLPGAEGLEIGECISKGDYQSVYRGKYHSRPVAVKKISDILVNRESTDLEKAVEDLRRECNILRAVEDPHIVEFIGVFNDKTQEGGVLLVTEFMEQTLETFLKDNRGILSKEKQVNICEQIASGLRYLHHRSPQILHRNLKPSNILLDNDGRIAKIGDISQVKFCPSDIQYSTTTQPGTVLYMPPEVLCDKEFTNKGDVFSLGVVMMEVATQEPPSCSMFGLGTVPEFDRRARDLSKLSDDHPLRALIRACLKDDPEERLTIKEVCSKLHQLFLNLKNPGAWTLYTEVKKHESKVFRSDVILEGNKLQSIQLPPLPTPTCHATAVVIGGKIYVGGGFCSNVQYGRLVQVYDTITAMWTALPPSPIYYSESTLVNGQLTLIGGRDASNEENTNLTITWDEEKKQWFPKVPPMPTKRFRSCIIHCNNLMLVAGGMADDKTLLDSVDIFNMDTFQWTTSRSLKLPLPMWDVRASISCRYVYIASGREQPCLGSKSHHNTAYKLPVEEVVNAVSEEQDIEWIPVQDTPYALSGLVVDSDQPIVVGGNDESGTPTSDVSIYDPTSDKWSNVEQCVRPHFVSCAIAVSSSSFVVIGGCTDDFDNKASLISDFELFYV